MRSELYVVLRSGTSVDFSVVREVLDLEARGVCFQQRPDGVVLAGPSEALAEQDRLWLIANKDAVRTIVAEAIRAGERPL